jgi:LPPG:FO 2-phospho-L-lactate transferase
MRVVAVAGGVGAGKFLRGLVRAVPREDVTVVVNTGDDLTLHGLHISPDIDSVSYWLSGVADRERGWGRAEDTFRVLETLRELGGPAWFGLGDLDLATHLLRTGILRDGGTLSGATAAIAGALRIVPTILPMSDDPVATMVECVGEDGRALDLHFQQYWVARQGRDAVKGVRYAGADAARPAPGVLEAVAAADAVIICPSNPVASILPILSISGIRRSLADRRSRVVGISPIVGGAPLRGMADRLMPAVGLEVSAFGAASAYGDLLSAFVVDLKDRTDASRIREELGVDIAVTDTIMHDDGSAERLATVALESLR